MSTRPATLFDAMMRLPEQAAAMRFAGAERLPDVRIELYTAPAFLAPDECAAFVRMIDARREPSSLVDAGDDRYFRTSETCYMDARDPLVAVLDARLALFTGNAPSHGEPLQGQRYAVGQEFKPHCDYFAPGGRGYAENTRAGGQRSWTAMLYLNEPGEGGETFFGHLDRGFVPETGRILAWNNQRADGTVNPMTLHHGMPVGAGTKYVLTKWYREGVWGRCQTNVAAASGR